MGCYDNHSRATKGNKIEKKCSWREFCSYFIRLQSSWSKMKSIHCCCLFAVTALKYHVNFHRTTTSFGWVRVRVRVKEGLPNLAQSWGRILTRILFSIFFLYFYPHWDNVTFYCHIFPRNKMVTKLMVSYFVLGLMGSLCSYTMQWRTDWIRRGKNPIRCNFDSCYWWFLLAWKVMLPRREGKKVQYEVYVAPNVRWSNSCCNSCACRQSFFCLTLRADDAQLLGRLQTVICFVELYNIQYIITNCIRYYTTKK